MYFKEFPKFLYDFKYGKETKTSIVTDITRNVRFRKEVLENVTLYDEYDIVDGETPEIIAEKIYGNPEYHWIIMLANQRYHYIEDFPKTFEQCRALCAVKYNPTIKPTSWSYSGTTITVTAPLHGLLVSPTTTVTITGATATTNAPNGTYNVTAVTANTFTFVKTGSAPTGTAGGTLTVKTTGREHYIKQYEITSAGEFDPDNIVHIVNSDFPGAVAITNAQYESAVNETKRRIKIISPTVISAILKQYKELL
jgi:hypothetical protein